MIRPFGILHVPLASWPATRYNISLGLKCKLSLLLLFSCFHLNCSAAFVDSISTISPATIATATATTTAAPATTTMKLAPTEAPPSSQAQLQPAPALSGKPNYMDDHLIEPTPVSVDTSDRQPISNSPKRPTLCADENYCLNGGVCSTNEAGIMVCLCPSGFYGARCQTRNICQTLIASSMTGDQLCARIGRECLKNDRFFRCSCADDEYFVFRASKNESPELQQEPSSSPSSEPTGAPATPANSATNQVSQSDAWLAQDKANRKQTSPKLPSGGGAHEKRQTEYESIEQLVECKKMDRCLGIRCRQHSEVCRQGECVCNRDSGYSRDPTDNQCKLLDPCQLFAGQEGQAPICGQARCLATYDHEIYRCLCPIGYEALKVGQHKNSTQCVPLKNTICEVPLLNKCQHLCHLDLASNGYKCSCLPGYRSGKLRGLDEHLCFFDEHFGQPEPALDESRISSGRDAVQSEPTYRYYVSMDHRDGKYGPIIKRELIKDKQAGSHNNKSPKLKSSVDSADILSYKTGLSSSSRMETDLADEFAGLNLNELSPQERCNIYCEDNKICVLEHGTSDSYRCVCERQGYVSVGDRCLDWCAAAQFSYRVRDSLDKVCLSGTCRPLLESSKSLESDHNSSSKPAKKRRPKKPTTRDSVHRLDDLEKISSWRPMFECDCSGSPQLIQDPETKLCKLDFEALLDPCKPGQPGYIDCVENKDAYCAVLYKPIWAMLRDLQKDKPNDVNPFASNLKGAGSDDLDRDKVNKSKPKDSNKLYSCVCSPEKKFLVDKPRNKARCIDECDLLNNECGRFNRMCRSATIAPDDFGARNLLKIDFEGVRMDFKRTGCECLPGFNVGPYESLDFTLDDNNRPLAGISNINGYSQMMSNLLDSGSISSMKNSNYNQQNGMLQGADQSLSDSEQHRIKYMNINSRCLLDYDVVEFHASFKAPADFDPTWIKSHNFSPGGQPQTLKLNPIDQPKHKHGTVKDSNRCMLDKPAHRQTKAPSKTEASTEVNSNLNFNTSGRLIGTISAPTGTTSPVSMVDDKCGLIGSYILPVPEFMSSKIEEVHRKVVLVSQCEPLLARLSLEAYQDCLKYRYWIVQKLRKHFVDWRRIMTIHLSKTFDLMEGNIRLHVNKCEATLKKVSDEPFINRTNSSASSKLSAIPQGSHAQQSDSSGKVVDLNDASQYFYVDSDVHCTLTIHSASDGTSPRYLRKVLLEKQLQKFIFNKSNYHFGHEYYLMAPNMLIRKESFDQLAAHRQSFNPCESDYAYCDKQTKCEMVDTVNFTCTCETGYTPIGSRDIYYADSRKEVCEDINECLFDACKELANVSTCINEVGDYKCHCNRHYIGDNKKFCTHVCNTIPCKHGRCRLVDDHHAFCECDDGYKETDCSVQDPNVALRKANMIICGSIFTSVLLLAITFAISLNSQLKKTKKKLKELENIQLESARLVELSHPQSPFTRTRVSAGKVGGS